MKNLIKNIRSRVILLRPHQYVKNILVFAPVFFGMRLFDQTSLIRSGAGFILMCIASSGVYIVNDIADRHVDRKHPTKKKRPIASGEVSVQEGVLLAVLLLGIALCGSISYGYQAFSYVLFYIVLNIAYSFVLKHIAIIDVLCISLGFVVRLELGSFLSEVPSSSWLIILTFLLSLLIALGKRRDDVLIFNSTGTKTRKVIDGYNLVFIDVSVGVVCAVTIVTYLLYTVGQDSGMIMSDVNLPLTSLLIVAGVLRYLQLVYVFRESGSPTKLLFRDRFMQAVVAVWIVSFVLILYF